MHFFQPAKTLRGFIPKTSSMALVSGLALMPLVISAGLWRDAATFAQTGHSAAPPAISAGLNSNLR